MANLSKVKIGDVIYTLKDAEYRALLDKLLEDLGGAAYLGVDDEVTENGQGAVKGGKIKEYVDAQVATIHKFDIVVADTLPTASADTMYKLYLIPKSGSATGNVKEEWITIRSGVEGSYTYAWEKIGDTEVDLSGYVQKTQKIAGIDLQDDITAEELKSALEIKELAHYDFNEVEAVVSEKTVSGIRARGTGTGSLIGDLGFDSTALTSEGSYTPSGSITGSAISGGTIGVTLGDSVSETLANVSRSDYTPTGTVSSELVKSSDGFQIEGTVSAPTISVSASTASVKVMKSAGVGYSITDGSVSKGNDSTSEFATEGMTAHMASGAEISGEVDAETLIFGAAAKTVAVTASGSISYTAPSLSGSLPEFEDATVATGIASASAAAPVFTGEKYSVSAEFDGNTETNLKIGDVKYTKQVVSSAEFNPVSASLGFSGTGATISVSGAYDKANIGTLQYEADTIVLDVDAITVPSQTAAVRAKSASNLKIKR